MKNLNDLHPKEKDLIEQIRNKYRYGEVTIITRDGLPDRIKVITEYKKLDE